MDTKPKDLEEKARESARDTESELEMLNETAPADSETPVDGWQKEPKPFQDAVCSDCDAPIGVPIPQDTGDVPMSLRPHPSDDCPSIFGDPSFHWGRICG